MEDQRKLRKQGGLTTKKLFTFSLAALAATILVASLPVSAEALRVGTERTYHPFNLCDSSGKLQGYDFDKAVGRLLGADIVREELGLRPRI